MKKYYEGPEITVRNYVLNPSNIVMTSDGMTGGGSGNGTDLGDGEHVTYPDDMFD